MKKFSPTTIKNLCGLSRSLELARIELDKAERIYNAEYFYYQAASDAQHLYNLQRALIARNEAKKVYDQKVNTFELAVLDAK
ncbi:MAG: hypothetical protein Q4A15_01055 [Prevotellaceae bacterium]|nr:hypothetical protein [Prevotellaceae bacterium]